MMSLDQSNDPFVKWEIHGQGTIHACIGSIIKYLMMSLDKIVWHFFKNGKFMAKSPTTCPWDMSWGIPYQMEHDLIILFVEIKFSLVLIIFAKLSHLFIPPTL